MISGIVILAILILGIKKNKDIIEKIFLFFAIPLSIAYAMFILPQNVPDEGTHIMKAYDISLGHFFTQMDEEGNSYSIITKAIEDYAYTHFRHYSNISEELNTTTNYNDEVRIVSAAQGNSPILYIGTATAFKICRAINVNYIYAIYLGRFFNIIIFLIFGYFSIKKIPFGKLLLAIYLCMPMMLQQAGSFSSDAILNATLIYYICHLIYLIFKEEPFSKKDKFILYTFTALIAMFKYIYILLAGILFVKIFTNKAERRRNLKTIAIMIAIGSVFSIAWFLFTLQFKSVPPAFEYYNKTFNVNSSEQINFIKQHPLRFLKIFGYEYLLYGSEYIFNAVGARLGWLEVDIDVGVIAVYIILLLICAISENSKYEISKKLKIWFLTLIFVISVILNMVMYLTFTPVGMERIAGVQGRYYTPILILMCLCFIKKENYWKIKNITNKTFVISLILNLLTLFYVYRFYI